MVSTALMYAFDMSIVTACNCAARPSPSSREELDQHVRVLTLACPDHASGRVIDNDGHVLVVLPIRQLIDADVGQSIEQVRPGARRSTTRRMMLPTVAHAMRIIVETTVRLHCCARYAVVCSNAHVNQLSCAAHGTISVVTPHW